MIRLDRKERIKFTGKYPYSIPRLNNPIERAGYITSKGKIKLCFDTPRQPV